MSSDRVIGPRGGTEPGDGAWTILALNGSTSILLPEFETQLLRRQRYAQISWLPAVQGLDGSVLYFLFVDPDDATAMADATGSTGDAPTLAKVAHSPDWIDGMGGERQRVVPGTRSKLLLKSTGAGRVRVALSE